MSREKMYSAVEKVDGGSALVDMIKAEFKIVDGEAKDHREDATTAREELKNANVINEGLEEKIKTAGETTVPKTEMEKQLNAITETLAGITKERDDEKALNESHTAEKKQAALEKHFTDAGLEGFGAIGSADAVAVSKPKLSYTEDGKMQYGDKVGDEGVEAFKADNARFLVNKGTHTPPASTTNGTPEASTALRDQMLRD